MILKTAFITALCGVVSVHDTNASNGVVSTNTGNASLIATGISNINAGAAYAVRMFAEEKRDIDADIDTDMHNNIRNHIDDYDAEVDKFKKALRAYLKDHKYGKNYSAKDIESWSHKAVAAGYTDPQTLLEKHPNHPKKQMSKRYFGKSIGGTDKTKHNVAVLDPFFNHLVPFTASYEERVGRMRRDLEMYLKQKGYGKKFAQMGDDINGHLLDTWARKAVDQGHHDAWELMHTLRPKAEMKRRWGAKRKTEINAAVLKPFFEQLPMHERGPYRRFVRESDSESSVRDSESSVREEPQEIAIEQRQETPESIEEPEETPETNAEGELPKEDPSLPKENLEDVSPNKAAAPAAAKPETAPSPLILSPLKRSERGRSHTPKTESPSRERSPSVSPSRSESRNSTESGRSTRSTRSGRSTRSKKSSKSSKKSSRKANLKRSLKMVRQQKNRRREQHSKQNSGNSAGNSGINAPLFRTYNFRDYENAGGEWRQWAPGMERPEFALPGGKPASRGATAGGTTGA